LPPSMISGRTTSSGDEITITTTPTTNDIALPLDSYVSSARSGLPDIWGWGDGNTNVIIPQIHPSSGQMGPRGPVHAQVPHFPEPFHPQEVCYWNQTLESFLWQSWLASCFMYNFDVRCV
jgi:hypothetical protein